VIDGTILSVSADVNLDRTRRDPAVEEDASTVASVVSYQEYIYIYIKRKRITMLHRTSKRARTNLRIYRY
jgi:hypothetical protein